MSGWTDATSLRLLISDDDVYEGRPLSDAILHAARDAGLAGAKVIRGTAGYGRTRHIHETWRGFSYDLPVVIEIIDTDAKIDAFLPILQRMRGGALAIRQRVEILQLDRAAGAPEL